MDTVQFRRATRDDVDSLADMLNEAYSWPHPPALDFKRRDPQLFTDARIGDHRLALVDEEIIGVVGAYPYDIRLDGVVVRGAAIGQVATSPSWRRRRIMAELMSATLRELDAEDVALTWLAGDSRRYGRYGYALGGVTVQYDLLARQVSEAPEPTRVSRMSHGEVLRTLIEHRAGLRNTLLVDEAELALVIAARDYGGHRLGEGWVIHDSRGALVYFGDGPIEDIEQLLLYLHARAPLSPRRQFTLQVESSDEPTALGRASLRRYPDTQRRPSCLWRVGALAPFLTELRESAAARIGGGVATLGLINTDNDQRVTLECRAGELHVHEGADDSALALDTRELSALCLGPEPLDYLIPDLPLDSPFRQVFPIHAHHTWFIPI